MSKPVTYQVRDAVNCLCIGATYTATKTGRMTAFVNVKTGVKIHLYQHEIDHAIARGALREIDETSSANMHCELVDKLCKHTADKFIY